MKQPMAGQMEKKGSANINSVKGYTPVTEGSKPSYPVIIKCINEYMMKITAPKNAIQCLSRIL